MIPMITMITMITMIIHLGLCALPLRPAQNLTLSHLFIPAGGPHIL